MRTENRAPITSARYQPKLIFLEAGRDDSQMAKRLIMKLAKSVNKCAASVAIARLLAMTPPTTSPIMNNKQTALANMRRLLALISIEDPVAGGFSPDWIWQCEYIRFLSSSWMLEASNLRAVEILVVVFASLWLVLFSSNDMRLFVTLSCPFELFLSIVPYISTKIYPSTVFRCLFVSWLDQYCWLSLVTNVIRVKYEFRWGFMLHESSALPSITPDGFTRDSCFEWNQICQ